MNKKGHVIAIGGGGFGRNPKHNKIEKYILGLIDKKKPNIVFLPTASAEDKGYIVNYYSCFSKKLIRSFFTNSWVKRRVIFSSSSSL